MAAITDSERYHTYTSVDITLQYRRFLKKVT